AGYFMDSIQFGPITLHGNGTLDSYFAKLDSNGNTLWATTFVGTGDDFGDQLKADASGNLYMLGTYSDSVTIGTVTLHSLGHKDLFIVKADPSGNIQWVKSGGSSGFDEVFTMQFDITGNLCFVAAFQDTAFFGTNTLISAGSYDIALLKYDANGNCLLATRFGGTGSDVPTGMDIDQNNNIYITGQISGTVQMGSNTLISNGAWDIFLAKCNPSGNVLWTRSYGGIADDGSTNIVVGADKSIYIAGVFHNTVTIGTSTLTSAGDNDVFIAKFDSGGTVQYAGNAASSAFLDIIFVDNLAIDNNGNFYVTGFYGNNCNFGAGNVAGVYDVFVASYNSNCVLRWVKTANGPGFQNSRNTYGIAQNKGSIYIAGSFVNDMSFDNSPLALQSVGFSDVFYAKIDQTLTTISTHDELLNQYQIYPNPVQDNLTITAISKNTDHPFRISILDVQGKQVIQDRTAIDNIIMDTHALSRGIYQLVITDKNGVFVKKLIK
ncbi:MAG: T9SS type A sorting domain-containing protein, partial [Bacteroidota bacterium]